MLTARKSLSIVLELRCTQRSNIMYRDLHAKLLLVVHGRKTLQALCTNGMNKRSDYAGGLVEASSATLNAEKLRIARKLMLCVQSRRRSNVRQETS